MKHLIEAGEPRVVSVRLDDLERQLLDQLGKVYGLDDSAVLRQLIATAPLWSIRMQEQAARDSACSCCRVHQ